jgi:threonylcarbamoyladenosine tRNA methylthiotransferase MtaB
LPNQGRGTIDRVRVSSIEPAELTNEIIELAAEKANNAGRLCHHFHIPLQSGDNTILKRMHRPYSREYFNDLVLRIVERIPDAAVGIDTLIGFPGETIDAFENSFALIQSLPAAYLHVFPFSPRKGTPAFSYNDKIHPSVIKERCKKMRQLGNNKRRRFYERFLNATAEVLVEEARDKNSGKLKGFTDNYLPIHFEGPDALFNTFQQVKVKRILENGIPEGVVVDA